MNSEIEVHAISSVITSYFNDEGGKFTYENDFNCPIIGDRVGIMLGGPIVKAKDMEQIPSTLDMVYRGCKYYRDGACKHPDKKDEYCGVASVMPNQGVAELRHLVERGTNPE